MPIKQYRFEPVQLLLQCRAVVTANGRFHLIPNPLHRASRRPAVAAPPAGIAPRSLFSKVHPQKVEAIPCIDDASLVFIDSHPQPRQELPQLRHVGGVAPDFIIGRELSYFPIHSEMKPADDTETLAFSSRLEAEGVANQALALAPDTSHRLARTLSFYVLASLFLLSLNMMLTSHAQGPDH